MNWKNVAFLVGVERKSGRLIRGQRLIHYRENKFTAYLFYFISLAIGITVGLLAGNFYRSGIMVGDPALASQIQPLVLSAFLSLPTLVLIYSLVFTMMGQIQRSGIKSTSQVQYWLPITWREHTLASILANMIGFPLISIVGIAAGVIIFASYAGFIVPAVLASLAMVAAAFMASATTEVLRILQVRFIGAVYKTSGRAAIWVRFAGSIAFFIVFYIGYFSIVYGSGAVNFVQTVASTQNAAWFVPFVWLGITLSYLTGSGTVILGVLFGALSLLFITGLYFLGVWLNERFGLYEPPAITVNRGIYAPKTGVLGRLGFSSTEAALIRKDLKAFTRRRELMTIFIGPIVIVLVPLFQAVGRDTSSAAGFSFLWVGLTFLTPACIMAMSLGSLMIGEEGQAVWRLYAAPISARSLIKSKYFFIVLFALIVVAITGTAGAILYNMSLRATMIALAETIFLIFTVAAVSLYGGIKGADFNEIPRPRMIRVEWSLLNLIFCALAILVVIAPVGIYVFTGLIPGLFTIDPIVAVSVSGVISAALTLIFYRFAVSNAKELLRKADI